MKKSLLLGPCSAAVLLLAMVAAQAQFDDGVSAMDAGDYPKALAAWQQSADSGDSRGQYGLGYLYQFGLAVPADLTVALGWYQKAAAAGNPDALYALGLLYETGKAGHRDLSLAMEYYRKAAAAGLEPDAEYAVGRMILRGRGVPRDPVEGIQWLKRAALHLQPAAEYMLGAAYEAGWGVPINDAEAYYWYRRSEEGDVVELEEQDVSFQPKIAIASLKRRLSAESIAVQESRLRKDLAAAKISSGAKGIGKTATGPPPKGEAIETAPPALTRQP